MRRIRNKAHKQLRIPVVVFGLCLVFLHKVAEAQNTFPASGNVGIGTTSPDKPLYVNGGIHLNMPGGINWSDNQSLLITNASDAAAGDTGAQIWHGDPGAGGSHLLIFSGYPQSSPALSGGYMKFNTVTGDLNVSGKISTNGPGTGLYFRTPSSGQYNTTVPTSLLYEGLVSGDGSAATPWGLNLMTIPWTWGGDAMTFHAGSYSWRLNTNGSGSETTSMTVNGSGLDVAGTIHSSGGFVFPDGTTQTTAFIPANCGADYAESVEVTGDRTKYEPGDVLVIDPNAPGKFLKSNESYSTMVAGIYSTQPGFVGRLHPRDAKTDEVEVPMAMVGRVPTKVSAENGPIKVGDLLVASSMLGHAMKGTDRSLLTGAVIGKALGSLDSGTGVIEVLVTLQ